MATIRPAPGKPKTLPPIHPNAGLEAAYRRKIEQLVDEMHRSLVYWLTAAYRANPPEMAQDAPEGGGGQYSRQSPAMALRSAMRKLGRRWTKRFDDMAPELAKYFATAVGERVDGTLATILEKAGWTVKFKMTAAANDVMQATIGEQVGLIKSLAQQHLTEVEGLVMRSVQTGRDLGTLTKDLEARYGVTRRRASLISRDQNAKATATIQRVRQQEIGVTHAKWVHSGAGRHPRPSHVKAGQDGVVYKISEGWLDPETGKRIWPGTEINCGCICRSIIPGIGPR